MNLDFPPIIDILPHRGTMLFIDAMTGFSSTAVTCVYQPQADAWYVDDKGNMPAWLGIEIMAQTIAAHVCLNAIRCGKLPKMGALLGSRNYQSSVAAFNADVLLHIDALLEFHDENGLGAYACSIKADGNQMASATLKVYEPDNFDRFIARGVSAS